MLIVGLGFILGSLAQQELLKLLLGFRRGLLAVPGHPVGYCLTALLVLLVGSSEHALVQSNLLAFLGFCRPQKLRYSHQCICEPQRNIGARGYQDLGANNWSREVADVDLWVVEDVDHWLLPGLQPLYWLDFLVRENDLLWQQRLVADRIAFSVDVSVVADVPRLESRSRFVQLDKRRGLEFVARVSATSLGT